MTGITLNIKDKSEYSKKENKVFAFLSVLGKYEVVGSGSIREVEYADDYDLMEYVDCKRNEDAYNAVLEVFQQKYRQAERAKDIYITDFKCGRYKGQPIRWNKESIKNGYKWIEDEKKYFIDCLQEESTIKMDVVVYIDGRFTEFSEMYFLTFGRFSTYPKRNIIQSQVIGCIQQDMRKKIECGKYFKAIKRYFSILKLQKTKNTKRFNLILEYLNGEIGEISSYKGDLETLKEVISNEFRLPPMTDIMTALEKIKRGIKTPFKHAIQEIIDEETRDKVDRKLCVVIKELSRVINKKTLQFIKKNNILLYK